MPTTWFVVLVCTAVSGASGVCDWPAGTRHVEVISAASQTECLAVADRIAKQRHAATGNDYAAGCTEDTYQPKRLP